VILVSVSSRGYNVTSPPATDPVRNANEAVVRAQAWNTSKTLPLMMKATHVLKNTSVSGSVSPAVQRHAMPQAKKMSQVVPRIKPYKPNISAYADRVMDPRER
jgi:hypothetical protein